MQDKEKLTPIDVYYNAIENYKSCKRELNECDLDIEVARMDFDTEALRKALSRRNQLLDTVIVAREHVQRANVDVVRERGMEVGAVKQEPGLMQRIIEKIIKV